MAIKAAVLLVVSFGSITLSLWITPMQEVSAAGQTIRVGVTAPSWDLSGPGELDLFGQSIPTTMHFDGPVRPRLALTHITFSEQLNQLTAGSPSDTAHSLQHALVRGWEHFFAWQIVVAGVIAIVVFGAIAGWLRYDRRGAVVLIAIGLVVTEGLNLGAIMFTAYTAPAKLSTVHSLQDLVGGSPPAPVKGVESAPSSPIRTVAVVGDSAAAGLGNTPLVGGDADDVACGRSQDAFAVDLTDANNWQVKNLACSGASIRAGLLGPQQTGARTQSAQLDSPAVAKADVIVVNIGANDVHWSDILRVCAVSVTCSNNAEQAYFQQQLSGFSRDYLQLLDQLQLLRNHPLVVINRYYDPFTGDLSCLAPLKVTEAKQRSMQADLAAMNKILSSGAAAAGFISARPDFSGHGLCSAQPYVQGPSASAPFHPTASGELAIALAIEHALHSR